MGRRLAELGAMASSVRQVKLPVMHPNNGQPVAPREAISHHLIGDPTKKFI